MAWTYTTLTQAIKDYANTSETTFSDNIENFIQSAEERILRTCQLPVFRKNVEGNMSAGTQYLATPSDYLSPFSLSVTSPTPVTSSSKQSFLLLKEVAFLREAYPNPTTTGEPFYYALFDNDTFMLAPTPDEGYVTELHYFYKPPSISTTADGLSWLGTNAPECLLYGSMVQANLFLKGESQMQQSYETQYQEALQRLRNESAGKDMQDSYRYGQPREVAV